MLSFSIVIPIFNEAENIKDLTKEIFSNLHSHYNFELILVNDCSTDNTKEIISLLKKKYSFKIINNKTNLGQSYSLLNGIKNSTFNTIVTLDGDLQNNPSDIPKMLTFYYKSNFKLVGGIRKKRKDKYIKIISSYLANLIRKTILNDDCNDTGCSLKVFDKDTFLKFPEFRGLHRFLPTFFKHHKKKMFFINVDHRRREAGKSNYGTIDRLVYGIVDLIRVFKIVNKIKND